MKPNMKIDTPTLEIAIGQLEEKITNIQNIYDDLNKKISLLNGDNDIWKGKVQESVYNYYLELSSQFPNTIKQLNNYKNFLQTTIENYKFEEESINHDILSNESNLNIN